MTELRERIVTAIGDAEWSRVEDGTLPEQVAERVMTVVGPLLRDRDDDVVTVSMGTFGILLEYAYRGVAAQGGKNSCHNERSEGCVICNALSTAEEALGAHPNVEWWRSEENPNQYLTDVLASIDSAQVHHDDRTPHGDAVALDELRSAAEVFMKLHEHLKRGGDLPDEWQRDGTA